MTATLTDHGKRRSKLRLGLSAASAQQCAELALRDGFKHADTAGSLKRYLDKLSLLHGGANFRIYAHKVFVFQDERLVTVLNLPAHFTKTVEKMKRQRKEAACR